MGTEMDLLERENYYFRKRFNRRLLRLSFSVPPLQAHQITKDSVWETYFEGGSGSNIFKGEAKWEKYGAE